MSNPTKDFEKKLSEAKSSLDLLMNPEITLENSVKSYKDGMKQLEDAQKMLESAKLEYETIKESVQGS